MKKRYHKPALCIIDMGLLTLLAGSGGSNDGIRSNQKGIAGGGIDHDGYLDPAAKKYRNSSFLWNDDM